MQRKFSLAMLAIAVGLTGLTGFVLDTVVAPRSLNAQACGSFSGQLCWEDCKRECSNGSCCSWQYYYYLKPVGET